MNSIDLTEYEYIWTTERDDWELLYVGTLGDRKLYAIVNEKTKGGLIIEDNDCYRAVVEKMIAEGIEVTQNLNPPKR